MFINYIKVAIRTLWKNKEFSSINIIGLAMGISTCLLIALYVLDELSYDRFNEKADRISRLTPTLHTAKGDRPRAVTSPIMGPTLKANFPEIESFLRITGSSRIIAYRNTKIYDTNILYADSTLFDFFSFPMLKGNSKTALVHPYSIVLTEKAARKYFGNEDPLGKVMTFSDTIALSVTGIIKDIPLNSHLEFDVLLSWSTMDEMSNHEKDDNWFHNNTYTYLLLPAGYDRIELENKFPAFLEKQMAREKKENGLWYDFTLQPLTDIHLRSNLQAEMGPNGSIKYVYIFSIVGLMVLLIACANYINLATAKSINRAKELGMRKVIGASKSQLVTQLMGESFLMTFISTLLAAAIISATLPVFNELTGKVLEVEFLYSLKAAGILVFIFLIVTLFAGAYPAFIMSSFTPIKTLKAGVRQGRDSAFLRKGLVVFQFTLSIILIAGTIFIFRQLDYMQNQNVGLNKEQIVELKLNNNIIPKVQLIKQELLKIPGVLAASASNFAYNNDVNSISVLPEGAGDNEISSEPVISVDHDFLKTFKIEIVAGRDFSRDHSTDEAEAFIINETAVRHFNWNTPEEAIGKNFDWGLGKKGKIIGVVKDFNFYSLHQGIRPLVIHLLPEWHQYISVKTATGDVSQTIKQLEVTWNKLSLDSPFDYSFMDKDFEKLYKAEQQTKSIIGLLSSLAIFIACLGLFGLAAFTAEQRTKEIGVRKVLGADVISVVRLLSRDFTKLIIISIILAIPIAWITISQWLDGFAYKIEMSWWVFVVAGASAILIALLTVSFQSIKAAIANPINSLRSE